jgi:hypothetical protein
MTAPKPVAKTRLPASLLEIRQVVLCSCCCTVAPSVIE